MDNKYGIPSRYQGKSADDLKVRDLSILNAIDRARGIAADKIGCLLLVGDCGSGKTTILTDAVQEAGKLHPAAEILYVSNTIELIAVLDAKGLEYFKRVDFLAMDDYGVYPMTPEEEGRIDDVICFRLGHNQATIVAIYPQKDRIPWPVLWKFQSWQTVTLWYCEGTKGECNG